MEIKKELYRMIKDVLNDFEHYSEFGVYVDEIDKENHVFGVRCFSQELKVEQMEDYLNEVKAAKDIAENLNSYNFEVVSGWDVFDTEEEYENFRMELTHELEVGGDLNELFSKVA